MAKPKTNRTEAPQTETQTAIEWSGCAKCPVYHARIEKQNEYIQELRKIIGYWKRRADQWRDISRLTVGQCFENAKNDMAALDRKLNKLFNLPPEVKDELSGLHNG